MQDPRQRGLSFSRALLILVGCAGIAMGIGVGLYAVFGLRPKLVAISTQLREDLRSIDRATGQLEGNSSLLSTSIQDLMSSSVAGIRSGGRIAALLPQTLTVLHGTLTQASQVMDISGHTASQASKGVSGLVLPSNALGLDDAAMRRTAAQLRLLAGMVDEIRGASTGLATDATRLSAQLARLQSRIGPATGLLRDTRAQIAKLVNALDAANLPLHASLAGIALGGLYVFLGIFSFALATIQKSTQAYPRVETGPIPQQRAGKTAA